MAYVDFSESNGWDASDCDVLVALLRSSEGRDLCISKVNENPMFRYYYIGFDGDAEPLNQLTDLHPFRTEQEWERALGILFNPAACDLLELRYEQIVGHPLSVFKPNIAIHNLVATTVISTNEHAFPRYLLYRDGSIWRCFNETGSEDDVFTSVLDFVISYRIEKGDTWDELPELDRTLVLTLDSDVDHAQELLGLED